MVPLALTPTCVCFQPPNFIYPLSYVLRVPPPAPLSTSCSSLWIPAKAVEVSS